MTYPFLIDQPKTLPEAARRMKTLGGRAALIGGGIEILDQARRVPAEGGQTGPEILIPLRLIAGTSYIEIRGSELRIGGATTIAEIAESAGIRKAARPLAEAAESVGSPQIRAQATLAGNLLQKTRCWYYRNGIPCVRSGGTGCPAIEGDNRYHAIFDGGPVWTVYNSDIGVALHALLAKAVILSAEGERVIPISELYEDPKINPTRFHSLREGDILREIRVPVMTDRYTGTFLKATERGGFDMALVSVAVVYNNFHGKFKNMQMFLGGVAPRPHVPRRTVDSIQFQNLSRNMIPKAAAFAAEGATPLAHNAYKISLVKSLVRQALEISYQRLSWKPD